MGSRAGVVALSLALAPAALAGDWLTSVSQAPAVRAKDVNWTAIVVASSERTPAITTGALARKGDAYSPSAGPGITGHTHALSGLASYYWQGQMTATGEIFDKRALTAAHKTLPFGTKVRVTRVDTGESVVVRINDRGPFKPGRVIDLSERAAEEIRMTGRGVMPVKLEVLGK